MSNDSIKCKELKVSLQENGIIRNSQGQIIAKLVDDVDFMSDHIYEEKDRKAFHVQLGEGETLDPNLNNLEVSNTKDNYFISKEIIERAYRKAMNQDLREQDFNSINKFSIELYKILDSFNSVENINKIEVLEKTISDMELASSGEFPDPIDKTKEISVSLDKIMKLYQSRFELMTKLQISDSCETKSDLANHSEIYRMQMAGIMTAATGHWKLGDNIHPDYETQALHDVADLYRKYDEKFQLVEKAGLTNLPNKITKEYLIELCKNVETNYALFPGTMHTTCCIKLPNGASFTGESVCASEEIFDEQKGRKYALEDLINKLWSFEGYVLKYKRFWAGLN